LLAISKVPFRRRSYFFILLIFAAIWVSAADAYVVSGTVTNNSGQTGRTYLFVNNSDGYGTSIDTAGAFTINGVPSGTYTITAVMDTRGDGRLFATDPIGVSTSFSITTTDTSGIAVTLTDPPAPAPPTPSWLKVYPGDGSAVLMWEIKASNAPRLPLADHYNLYWSTSASVSPNNTSGGGSRLGIPHPRYAPFFMTGLTNSATLYFVVTAVVNGAEGEPSPVYGPVTIGPPSTAGVTVEGSVLMSGFTPTGPLCIGLFGGETLFQAKCFSSPTTSQPFQFDNVPDGYYRGVFAFVDMNSNGVEDPGDITDELGDGASPVLVQGSPVSGVTVSLGNAGGRAVVRTEYDYPSSYNLFFEGVYNSKMITNMTILSGPNLAESIDVPWDDGWFDTWSFVLPGRPTIGDTYSIRLRYSDGTVDTLSPTITDILDGYSTPISPSGTTSGLAPLMTWTQPTVSPSQLPLTYKIRVKNDSGSTVWDYTVPGNRTYATYNEDGTGTPLISGSQYHWSVQVKDEQGSRGNGPTLFFTPVAPTLSILKQGIGTGDVSSIPSGISCGLSCSAQFPLDQLVMLSATPSAGGSIFSGWSGDADCSDGIVTLSADMSCTATFNLCDSASIAMTGSSGPFASINAAYVAAYPTDTIRIIASNQQEGDLVFGSKDLTLRGGYDCAFTEPPTSFTTITGLLTISSGSLNISGIRIQ